MTRQQLQLSRDSRADLAFTDRGAAAALLADANEQGESLPRRLGWRALQQAAGLRLQWTEGRVLQVRCVLIVCNLIEVSSENKSATDSSSAPCLTRCCPLVWLLVPLCSRHKLQGMVNLRNRRCEQPGCCKEPYFGECLLYAVYAVGGGPYRWPCSTYSKPGTLLFLLLLRRARRPQGEVLLMSQGKRAPSLTLVCMWHI